MPCADGNPVYILKDGGYSPYVQDFEDFIEFARGYGCKPGDANWNPQCDITRDDIVNFADFISFAQAYGREAVSSGG
jgi:hypothetical protein